MEFNNTSCEPMDIDISSNSVSAMEISYNENIIIKTEDTCDNTNMTLSPNIQRPETNFKKLVVNLDVKHAKRKNKHNVLYALGIFFLLLSLTCYHLNINYQCYERINTEKIRHNLLNRMYGQTTAATQIMKTLESDMKNKILIMYGGTGVGKILAVSLILEDILKYANVYHYTMLNLIDLNASDLLFGFTWCQSSIVIVDDLRHNDLFSIKDFIKTLITKSEKLSRNLTVILNYNCDIMDSHFSSKCNTNFASELKNNFSDIYIEKSFIEFNQLDNNVLRKCVEHEMGNKKVTEEQMTHILRNFDVVRDGCKGVHQKIKYLSII
ncbi:uncharacterized protein LOC125051405 [Pieris napi]|uniref:uncharacterized protein LOC125051405 n=1 Tax=Pieris napi TaxID=78633 RepID=UPI001FBB0A16|nr:uncharacterized protein LOC125051405 [Pieris napi]